MFVLAVHPAKMAEKLSGLDLQPERESPGLEIRFLDFEFPGAKMKSGEKIEIRIYGGADVCIKPGISKLL
jgi:hypothetical protein